MRLVEAGDYRDAELVARAEFESTRDQALMILQVHDELVFEADADFVPELLAEATSRMAAAAQLSVPLVVDSGVGNNWEEAH